MMGRDRARLAALWSRLQKVKGFLACEEAHALHEAALAATSHGPLVEIGSYCGRSTGVLGDAAREIGTVLFAVDHHRGSEETQPGWPHHDTDTWDSQAEAVDTLPFLRRTIRDLSLEATVIPVVGESETVARYWRTPIRFLFIDGGHGREVAWADYRAWTPYLERGGVLAIHDVFENPEDGGRPPFEIWSAARASGLYEEIALVRSLGVLRRL